MNPGLVLWWGSEGGGTMTLGKGISLLLVIVPLFGCASQLQSPKSSPTIAEKEGQEQKQDKAAPTFTYRPGG
jgi:hypothetical protein